MKAATPTPMMPSMTSRPVALHSTAESRTTPVETTSLRLSAAVASRVSDWMASPTVRLNRLSQSLTAMDGLKPTGSGWSTLRAESLSRLRPMAIIMVLTASPATYS